MAAPLSGRGWQRCRTVFRWCRWGALLLVLVVILFAAYLQRVGLPEPLKAMVLGALLDRGFAVEFQRLRLHWSRGLVADGLSGREAGSTIAPAFAFKEVTVALDWPALLRRRFDVRGLGFHEGRLTAPLHPTNAPPEFLVLDVRDARLEFGADGTWTVEELAARCEGLTLTARGRITNGSALPRTTRAALRVGGATPRPGSVWQTHLRRLKRQVSRLRFSEPPRIHLTFRGDGRDLASFSNELRCTAGGVWTPWGELRRLDALARIAPAGPEHRNAQRIELRLGLDGASTRWGSLRNAQARAVILQPFTNALPERITWDLRAAELSSAPLSFREAHLEGTSLRQIEDEGACRTEFKLVAAGVESPWGSCQDSHAQGEANHRVTNLVPTSIKARIEVSRLDSGPLALENATADFECRRVPSPPGSAEPDLAFWRDLATLEGRFALRTGGLRQPQLELESLAAEGRWQFPRLELTNLVAGLYEGRMQVEHAGLDVITRDLNARVVVDFDVQRLTALLPPKALAWLSQFQYVTPPHAEATARVRLPPWRGSTTDRSRELRKSLELRARLDGREVVFNGLRAQEAGVTLTISNEVLRLRDLSVIRPEGRAELSYDLDLAARDFRWRLQSGVDAQAAAPAIDPVLPGVVRHFAFPTPLEVRGEVWGNWNPPKVVDFALQLAATNFAFRGEPFMSLAGTLQKTGSQLAATQVQVLHATGDLVTPGAGYDLADRVVTLTNARSRMDPLVVARCIDAGLEDLLEPYRFATPPAVEVNGRVHAGASQADSDLVFAVEGDAFRFWRFHTRKAAGVVRWTDHRVGVTNVACEFYGGRLSGEFILESPLAEEPRFHFQARATDFDLRALLDDTLARTNEVAGTVTGTLVVTNASLADWTSWHGYGQVRMREGVLWDLPILGALSKVMNLVAPGTGNSRATAAQGTYTITQSVIHTGNLEIDAGPARLNYAGTVDFQGNVDARVMAEVLHATPVIGPFISLVFSPAAKALEFKVSGTLSDPVLKPLYVPGFLLPLLNPIGAAQNLFAPKSSTPESNGK